MLTQFTLTMLFALTPAQTTSSPWLIEYGLTADQLKTRTMTLTDAGYQPLCVSGFNQREDARFAVVWEKKKSPAWRMDYGVTPAQLEERAVAHRKVGYRPIGLSGYDLVGAQGFIDLWKKVEGPAWEVHYGQTAADLESLSARLKKANYRPISVSTYVSGSVNRFATIWEKGGEVQWELKWGLKQDDLDSTLSDFATQGFRPLAIAGLGVEEDIRFAIVLVKKKGNPWIARYNLNAEDVSTLITSMKEKSYRPVWFSGYNTLRGVRYASIWEQVKE